MERKRGLLWFNIFIPDILEAIREKNLNEVKLFIKDFAPSEIEEIMSLLPETEQALLFRLLDKEKSAEVLSEMSKSNVEKLLAGFTHNEVKELLSSMSPDDRARVFDEMPAEFVNKFLKLLEDSERKELLVLLNYPEDSAGHQMRPDFASIRAERKVKDAIRDLREKHYDEELLYEIFVTSSDGKLLGKVTLPHLVLSNPETYVSEIMEKNPIAVFATTDQEECAEIMKRHDLISLPVVDSEEKILGILTVDDIIDVMEQEATEDIHKLAGIGAHFGEEEYFHSHLFKRIKKRAPWLITFLLFEIITVSVVKIFKGSIVEIAALAFFIPMLIATGGNVGSQSVTLIVRALATGEIRTMQFLKVFFLELLTSIGMGIIIGIIGGIVAQILVNSLKVTLTVGFSLIGIVLFANLLGLLLPFIFKLVRIDPAVASSPLIATLMDIVGVSIYFTIAKFFIL